MTGGEAPEGNRTAAPGSRIELALETGLFAGRWLLTPIYIGLLVAIPAVVAYNVFKGMVKDAVTNTEALSRILLAELKAAGGEDIASSGEKAVSTHTVDNAADHERRYNRPHVLQSCHRGACQRPTGKGDRCPGRPDGQGYRCMRHPVPAA